MEAFKNAMAVLAGIIGVLTAFLTLYAKYLDVKNSATRKTDVTDGLTTPPSAPEHEPAHTTAWPESPSESQGIFARPARNGAAIARARDAVRAPATTLIIAGLISLFSNLFLAAFGYVDQFVTPLTTESRNRQAYIEAAQRRNPSYPMATPDVPIANTESGTVVLTVFTLMGLSVASAAAIWAGYDMLRLRGYWLSVAGSFAIMAGAGFCCMAGIPIGIWTLSVLYKPEVSSSFA